jgi:DNA-binding transcriptional ArsR family regulator
MNRSAPDMGGVRSDGELAELNAQRIAVLCKALAHPARVRIVAQLRMLNRCVCGRIVEALPLAQSTVSQHLKILKDAGLVKGEIEGPRTCYCLDSATLAEFKKLAAML